MRVPNVRNKGGWGAEKLPLFDRETSLTLPCRLSDLSGLQSEKTRTICLISCASQ